MNEINGFEMYEWVRHLFPLCRSITGSGNRETLNFFKSKIPEMNILSFPTNKKVFDWVIPEEWNIRDAFVADTKGNKIIDFKQNNLHLMGYSSPVDKVISFEELDQHLHSLVHLPKAIPYVTSYYNRDWGFCLSHEKRESLNRNEKYHVLIDSSLAPGKKEAWATSKCLIDFLAYADGSKDLVEVADEINESSFQLIKIAEILEANNLIKK